MSKRLRAVIYARVSGDQQRRDGTIQTQLAMLPRWIESQGWELVGIYTDDGRSASKNLKARGDFARLRADAERKAYDIVVWVDLDRASRTDDWGEFGSIISTFQRNGIKLAEPDVGIIEPGTMSGNMTIFMKWQRSADENRVRRNKTMDGRRRMARDVGGHAYGRIPYGLRWDARMARRPFDVKPADGSPHPGWSIDPHEGGICREIHARFVAGESGHEIARDLMRRKEPTRRGGAWFDPVNRILTSLIYRGEARYHGFPVTLPAIIDEDTWFKTQALIATSKKRGLKQTRHTYLAEGLGTCSVCQSPIYIRAGGRLGSVVRYYVCRDRCDIRVDLGKRCELPRKRADTVDQAIWCDVRDFLLQPRHKIIAAIRGHEKAAAEESAAWMADVKRYQEQLDALDAAVGVFMEHLEGKLITPEQFKAHAAKSTQKRRMLQEQMKAAEAAMDMTGSSRAATEKLEAFLDEWRELVTTATLDERQALLRALVRKGGLVFDAKGVKVRLVLEENRGELVGGDVIPGMVAVTLRVVA